MLDNRKNYMVHGWENIDQDDSKIYLNDNYEAQEVCRMIAKLTGKSVHVRKRISKDNYEWCYSFEPFKNDRFNKWAESNGHKYDYETKRYFEKNLNDKELNYVYDSGLSFIEIERLIRLKEIDKNE